MQLGRMYSIKEAAKLIGGISEYRIREMCKDGSLPCLRAGKKFMISEANIKRYILHELADDTNANTTD